MGKIVVWDLECHVNTFPSKGMFGGQRMDGKNAYLLSANFMYLDKEKPFGLDLYQTEAFKRDFQDDYDLVKFSYDILTAPDVEGWVGFYSKSFDLPLLNARLQYHKLPCLPEMPHDDIHSIFKSKKGKIALASYSLDYLCKFYELPEKTKVPERDWILAKAGDHKAQKKIGDYGRNDVLITRLLYEKARLLNGTTIVHVTDGDKLKCNNCGSTRLKSNGRRYHKNGKTYRQEYQCKDCTKWRSGPTLKIEVKESE